MMLKSLSVLCAVLFGVLALNNHSSDEWKWSEDRSRILSYLMNGSEFYDVSLNRPAGHPNLMPINVVISKEGREIYKWKSHNEGTFVFSGTTLVYSKHIPNVTGCQLVAVDLRTAKVLWDTHLKGAGPIEHSKYRNRINLVVSKNVVTVYGNESGGQYIEQLDFGSGKTISNTLGPKDGHRF